MAALVDTSVLIELERRGEAAGAVLHLRPGTRLAIAAITAAELYEGVEAADTDARRVAWLAFVEEAVRLLPVLTSTSW